MNDEIKTYDLGDFVPCGAHFRFVDVPGVFYASQQSSAAINCNGCFFDGPCTGLCCSAYSRKDGKNVIFVRVDNLNDGDIPALPPDADVPIGSPFYFVDNPDVKLEAIPSGCNGCYFYMSACDGRKCGARLRADGCDVIFREVK